MANIPRSVFFILVMIAFIFCWGSLAPLPRFRLLIKKQVKKNITRTNLSINNDLVQYFLRLLSAQNKNVFYQSIRL